MCVCVHTNSNDVMNECGKIKLTHHPCSILDTQLIFKRSGMAPPGAQQQGGGGPPKEVKFIPTSMGGAFID